MVTSEIDSYRSHSNWSAKPLKKNLAVKRFISFALMGASITLAACASGPVKLKDKDTTGRFDGVWVASVEGPRAKKEDLPGNWTVSCDWEPFKARFLVSDGLIKRSNNESSTPVSTEGDFQLNIRVEGTGINSYNRVYEGKLAEPSGTGRYMVVYTAYGATGCSASMNLEQK